MAVDQYTKSLLHFDGSDGSTTITDECGLYWARYGNAQLDVAQYKFGGSSLLLDGTGDYLYGTLPAIGTQKFTMEAWVRFNVITTTGIFDQRPAAGTSNNYILLHIRASNVFSFYMDAGYRIDSPFTVSTGTWYHLVLQGNGEADGSRAIRFFVNGTYIGRYVSNYNLAGQTMYLLGSVDGYPVNGWGDEFRLSIGVERYTSCFTLPTSESSTDAYSKLLLHMNGDDGSHTFTDECGKTVNYAGDAQIDTAFKKLGTGSGLFDGTGDYLTVDASTDFNFGSGDFTIDFWMKSTQTTQYATIVSKCVSAWATGHWIIMTNETATGEISFWAYNCNSSSSILRTRPGLSNTGNWTHVVVQRNGNWWVMIVNGYVEASYYASTAIVDVNITLAIGRDPTNGRYYNGALDELHISKGIARYSYVYTLPTNKYGHVNSYLQHRNRERLNMTGVSVGR